MYCSNLRELQSITTTWPLTPQAFSGNTRCLPPSQHPDVVPPVLHHIRRLCFTESGPSERRFLFCFYKTPKRLFQVQFHIYVVAIFLYSSSTTESSSGLWGGLGVEGIVNLIQICMFFGCGGKLMHTYRGNADSAQSGFVTLDSRRRPFNIHHRISLKTHSLNFWSLIKLV